MKKIILVLSAVLTVILVNGQSLTFEQLKNVPAKKTSYIKYTEYVSSDGTTFKVGDYVKIGNQSGSNRYNHILTFVPLTNPINVTGNMYGRELKIKKIKVNKTFIGENCISLWVDCGITGSYYIIDLEPAISNGEIIGDSMKEEQVLKEIEMLKKKFELEIITEEEYKTRKAELVKYIK